MATVELRADQDQVDAALRRVLAGAGRLRRWFAQLGRACRIRHDAARHCFDITITGPVLSMLLAGMMGLLVLVATSDRPGEADLRPSTARLRAMPAHPSVMNVDRG